MKFCQGVLLVPKNESHIFPATNKAVLDDIIIFESEKVLFSIKKNRVVYFLKIHSVGKMDARPGSKMAVALVKW